MSAPHLSPQESPVLLLTKQQEALPALQWYRQTGGSHQTDRWADYGQQARIALSKVSGGEGVKRDGEQHGGGETYSYTGDSCLISLVYMYNVCRHWPN